MLPEDLDPVMATYSDGGVRPDILLSGVGVGVGIGVDMAVAVAVAGNVGDVGDVVDQHYGTLWEVRGEP